MTNVNIYMAIIWNSSYHGKDTHKKSNNANAKQSYVHLREYSWNVNRTLHIEVQNGIHEFRERPQIIIAS